jgi:phosphoribosylamine--glycine ligase
MKILIIGSGAKEYTLAKQISYYENTDLVFVAPGNDAIAEFANCIDINANEIDELANFAKTNEIDLTIVCSERAIENDIAEKFNEQGLMVFAPTVEAARITTSKSVSKKFMYKTKIPTPRFGIFDRENIAIDYARKSKYPLIVKTDMHEHGENVFVCDTFVIAKRIINELFDRQHKKVIIEDFVAGQEFSYYIITDGYNAMPLTSVVPYKYVLEGNGGAITSGLGGYAPFYMIDSKIEERIFKKIVYPALDELSKNGAPYIGILGIDIILDRLGNLNVIEFNPFFKEPDAQCALQIIDENLLNVMQSAITGTLVDEYREIMQKDLYSASVVLSAGNYPNEGTYGSTISGLNEAEEYGTIAHFNTIKNNNNEFMTKGGRTLVVTSTGATLEKAVNNMYECAEEINFDSCKYRKDIGKTLCIGC